jgi:hypothetical protein
MTSNSGAPSPRHPRFLAMVVLASIVLTLPAILSGYMADDYFFTGGVFLPDAPFGYYNFTEQNVETEIQQWWSSPRFKMRFFRPLSSLTLHLDFGVLRLGPLAAHLHSVLWFVLLLIGAHLIFVKCLDVKAAKWATVMFSLSVMHCWSAGWIAARHAVVGGAFATFAAYAYLVWREDGRLKYGVASAGLFVLGLLSTKVALSFLGFAISYEAIFSKRPWSDRLRSAAPFLGIGLLYLVFYELMGFGAGGSDAYTDPFSQPRDFLFMLIPKTLALMGAFVLGVPGILRMTPETAHLSTGIGAFGLLLLAAGLFLCWSRFAEAEKRTVKWLALMGTLGLFPGVAGAVMTQGREFVLSGLAVLGIASLTLTALFYVKGTLRKRVLARAVGALIFAGTLVFSPLSRVGMGAITRMHAELSSQMGGSKTGCKEGSHVVVISGDFEVPIAYAPHLVAGIQGRFFRSWHQLAITKAPIRSRPKIQNS